MFQQEPKVTLINKQCIIVDKMKILPRKEAKVVDLIRALINCYNQHCTNIVMYGVVTITREIIVRTTNDFPCMISDILES